MIKNLPRQLNEAGKIKIGKKGAMIKSAGGTDFRPPKKLDHFQLVTTERDENGDFIVDTNLQNKIRESKSCLLDSNDCLIGLPIRLLYNDTELNFPNRYVSYVSGKLSCHGDGEVSHKRIDDFKIDHPCPCDRITPGYANKDKCKPTGTLTCIIDEAGLFGQAHKFRTTSMNTIKGILGGIELIKTATGGKIAGLPLMLTMNPKQTTTPGGVATTIYIVSVCYRGSMSDLRREVLELMSTEKQYLISMDSIEADAKKAVDIEVVDSEDEKDFVEEFFPDAVDITDISAKTKTVEKVVEKTVEKVEPEKEPEQEIKKDIEPDPDIKPENTVSDDKELAPVGYSINGLEPVGSYKKIYDRFVIEKDLSKALLFANRLQRGNLLYWLVNTYPDVIDDDFNPGIKKPDLIIFIGNVLKSVFDAGGDTKINTDSAADKVKEKEPETGTVETKDKDNEESKAGENKGIPGDSNPDTSNPDTTWDDSGPIGKPQLRNLVKVKLLLEAEGTLKPNEWVDQVKVFTDADKNPIEKATKLTLLQGETFIAALKKHVKDLSKLE